MIITVKVKPYLVCLEKGDISDNFLLLRYIESNKMLKKRSFLLWPVEASPLPYKDNMCENRLSVMDAQIFTALLHKFSVTVCNDSWDFPQIQYCSSCLERWVDPISHLHYI